MSLTSSVLFGHVIYHSSQSGGFQRDRGDPDGCSFVFARKVLGYDDCRRQTWPTRLPSSMIDSYSCSAGVVGLECPVSVPPATFLFIEAPAYSPAVISNSPGLFKDQTKSG